MAYFWATVVLKSWELSLGLISVCACDWFLLLPPQRSQFLAKNSSLLTLWKACKNMTQPVNANAAPHSSWETDVSVPSASQSGTSSSPLSPCSHRVKSCRADTQLHAGGGGKWDRVCCFNFGFTTLHFKQYHWHHYKVVLLAEPSLWAVLCHAPEKNPPGITENESHDNKETKPGFCFLQCSRLYM